MAKERTWWGGTRTVERPVPLGSVVASAKRITSAQLREGTNFFRVGQEWQDDAWDMFDLVGEQRFLATTLANRMSQARLFIGEIGDDPTEEPTITEDDDLQEILNTVGGGQRGAKTLIQRMGVNLFITGEVWLAGIPNSLLPKEHQRTTTKDERAESITLSEISSVEDMWALEWFSLSVNEVEGSPAKDKVTIKLGDTSLEVDPDEIYLIKAWRSHPRDAWEADSPTRSSLPILRELVGLTMHVSAQTDSRLAGAGMLIVPRSVVQLMKNEQGMGDDLDPNSPDPFTEALIDSMVTPISDRGSASAVVPLVITAPDDAIEKFRFISFSQPLDERAAELREESIRRLALGQDAPPEILLGTGGMNHWGAWLVREDVVTTHLEPPLSLLCDALTAQFLWPVMEALGYPEEKIRNTVVWYDVDHLISRPNRASDAMALYDKGELSGHALRDASGFDETDAPVEGLKPWEEMVLRLVERDPGLIQSPGINVLREQIEALMRSQTIEDAPAPIVVVEDTSTDTEEDTEPDVSEETEEIEGDPSTPPATSEDDAPMALHPPRPLTAADMEARAAARLAAQRVGGR